MKKTVIFITVFFLGHVMLATVWCMLGYRLSEWGYFKEDEQTFELYEPLPDTYWWDAELDDPLNENYKEQHICEREACINSAVTEKITELHRHAECEIGRNNGGGRSKCITNK